MKKEGFKIVINQIQRGALESNQLNPLSSPLPVK
jgi:hypothetical protein